MTHINLYRTVLAPALMAQGFWVRRRTPRLPEPAGYRSGRWGSGPDMRLLIAGDSSAAGVGVARQEKALSGRLVSQLGEHRRVSWTLVARTGALTADVVEMLGRVPSGDYDIAVTALGVNDITERVPLDTWLDQTEELHDVLTARFKVRRIIASGLPPLESFPLLPQPLRWYLGREARNFDEALRKRLAGKPNVEHLPMVDFPRDGNLLASDGYHPGEEIYETWAKWVARRCLNADTQH
ncbi:MAG: SGNH/GDSL hydrolase family protein [Paracoccaceae bacterium]